MQNSSFTPDNYSDLPYAWAFFNNRFAAFGGFSLCFDVDFGFGGVGLRIRTLDQLRKLMGTFHTGDFIHVGEHFGRITTKALLHTEIQSEDRDLMTLEIELKAGEMLRVDTGCLVGFSRTVDYDIEFVGGIRNTIFGGEGMFFATLRGPGTVAIQSLPFSRLANRVLAYAPKSGGKSRGEGSILGGLGDLLDGDNRF